jgi:hypothetical protein
MKNMEFLVILGSELRTGDNRTELKFYDTRTFDINNPYDYSIPDVVCFHINFPPQAAKALGEVNLNKKYKVTFVEVEE